MVTFCIFVMRIIATQTLKKYCEAYPLAEQALLSWYEEAETAEWPNAAALKVRYWSASILDNKRVIFNINGNNYRLIVDIEFRLKIIFVVWFGSHAEYDKINAKAIKYAKTYKK